MAELQYGVAVSLSISGSCSIMRALALAAGMKCEYQRGNSIFGGRRRA